jgi:hypothetical protein
VSDLDGWHRRHEGSYWFGPPKSNTLRSVSSDHVLMPGKSIIGVTNWSGEGVRAKVPEGVARATCIWVSNDQLLKRLPSSPFYRRKGEGQKGIQICATMIQCWEVFSHVDVC